MPFVGSLQLEEISESDEFKLLKEIDYLSNAASILVRVPVGFRTDLASIPPFLRPFFNRNGKSKKAAVVHDFLYSLDVDAINRGLSRETCDALFYEALIECGVSEFAALMYFCGVRALGFAYFRKGEK